VVECTGFEIRRTGSPVPRVRIPLSPPARLLAFASSPVGRARWVRIGLALCFALGLLPALSGCAGLHERWIAWNLAQENAAMRAQLEPALRARLDASFAEGTAALARNDLNATIAAWRRHVADAPPAMPRARQLRGWLTLLERESARRFVQQGASRESAAFAPAANRLHVAVLPFRSEGPNAAKDPFNRALLAMIAVDLAQVPTLTVLERERIDTVLREQRLALSGLIDPSTLAGPARLLGAGSVVSGTLYNEPSPAGPGQGRYTIRAAVSDVGQRRVLGTQDADGKQGEFFRLQKEIVFGILQTLEVRDIPPGVARVHTRSWQAYARFAAGLAALSEDRFDDARQAFAAALEFDPYFALAEEALWSTPQRLASVEQIRAEATAGTASTR
jgi:TolB-like protein